MIFSFNLPEKKLLWYSKEDTGYEIKLKKKNRLRYVF